MKNVLLGAAIAVALIWAAQGSVKDQDRVAATLKGPGTIVVQRQDIMSTVAIQMLPARDSITASMEPRAADMAAFHFLHSIGQADTGLPDH